MCVTQRKRYQHVFFVLCNAKILSFALVDAKLPNANGFASQWNIGFKNPGCLLTFLNGVVVELEALEAIACGRGPQPDVQVVVTGCDDVSTCDDVISCCPADTVAPGQT